MLRNVLTISGIEPDCTLQDVEDAIVLAADGDSYDKLYFDETDDSYKNYTESLNIQRLSNHPTSEEGSDSYVITTYTPLEAIVPGTRVTFIPDVNNTGSCRLKVNDFDSYNIVDQVGDNLSNNTIVAGNIVTVEYSIEFEKFVLVRQVPGTTTTARETRLQSDSQGWMLIINAIASLKKQL